MALAQGSGELVWWPFIVAKYGLGFLFLLVPACLLQFPLNYEIGRYTVLTGETIWQGFIRLSRPFAFFLWVLMITSFLWFGAFASAGGTALASLTNFPWGYSPRAQSLFWGYLTIAVYFCALSFSRVVYNAVEKVMMAVAVITVVGLCSSVGHPQVSSTIPRFVTGLLIPQWPEGRVWDVQDATKLLTAVTFAGLGGFWTLFYSYWLREKGAGMSRYFGRITSPITGKPEVIPETGFIPDWNPASRKEMNRWLKFLFADCGIGVVGNLLTTLLTCLLSYALLFPERILPQEWEIAVVQSRFFEVQWGSFGRILFLVVAAAFLSDTWMATADAVSRVNTDIVYGLFPRSRKFHVRSWYYAFLILGTVVTCVTMLLSQPGPLILLSAVIGFAGTVIYSAAVLILNCLVLPKNSPDARPGRVAIAAISLSVFAYFSLMVAYLYVQF
ncbi:MAG: Nramp family divalent metal transporter [Acidobacteria bacterium]|nr:Nramp family divalent metal transporter [Acidobacteriota bacterium]